MTLTGKSTLYGHKKAHTMYITIPAGIASDSQFPFKAGDTVQIVQEGDVLKVRLLE